MQRRLRLKTEIRKEVMANIEGQLAEKVQRAHDGGYIEGYDRGVKDATRSSRENAFSDLHLAWAQVQRAHQDAANYAGIVSGMYGGPKAEAKKEEK